MHYLDFMEDERLRKFMTKSREQCQDVRRHSLLELTDRIHPDARRDGSQEVYFTEISLFNQDIQKILTGQQH